VVEPGTPALQKIKAHFGEKVIQEDGTLDRKALGSIIFNDAAQRAKLNAIVHPAVRKAMFWEVVGHWLKGEKICIMDVPLLIEGPLHKMVGKVVVVYWQVYRQLLSRIFQLISEQLGRDPTSTTHEPGLIDARRRSFPTTIANAHC